ncbi:MAG: Tellurium resistance protein TerA [Alphaproteobacteria bacterium]|nr:Tellurium resistance protein TerA [Alphaproteobacteria bacterium]
MSVEKPLTSVDSLAEATRSRASFSGHGRAMGAAGYRVASNNAENCEFLHEPGSSIAVSPGAKGFESIQIGVAWDTIIEPDTGLLGKLFKKNRTQNVDLDLGCLYELQDGTRGALQAFGKKFGNVDAAPFIHLSGDERTGAASGYDEYLTIKGSHWSKIKRILVYLYIYEGAQRWSKINPQIILDVPGENDLVVTLSAHNDALALCAIGGLENIRNGIKLTNYTEYFPGHEEMDRAFGFGLPWDEGKKDE